MNKEYTILEISIVCALFILTIVSIVKSPKKLTVEDFIKYYDATIELKEKQKAQQHKEGMSFHWEILPVNSKVIKIISWVEDKEDNEIYVKTNITESIWAWDYPYSPELTFESPRIMLRSNLVSGQYQTYERVFKKDGEE